MRRIRLATQGDDGKWYVDKEIVEIAENEFGCKNLGEICEAALNGEPVFVIRARDATGEATIEGYYENLARAYPESPKLVDRDKNVNRFMKWRDENPDKVRIPGIPNAT